MSLIHNERTKLTATYFNGLALAVFGVGGLAPLFSYAFSDNDSRPLWAVALVSVICMAISAALHLLARRRLGAMLE